MIAEFHIEYFMIQFFSYSSSQTAQERSQEMASQLLYTTYFPIGPRRRNLLAEDLELRDSNGNLF